MPLSEQTDITAILDRVSCLLDEQGHQGYIVGGFIRDWLLDRRTNDVDIAVDGNALDIGREIAKGLGGKFVLLDEANEISRVVLVDEEGWHLDFSSFSGDIESDLVRRDFTIDAMAVKLGQMGVGIPLKLIDPLSGKDDLENKTLRAVNERVFEADAARLLRAVRLATELDFTIERETESLIRCYCQFIIRIPGERIREELLRLLSLPGAAQCLRYLDDLGLLLALFPELIEAKGVDQPTTHFWDVFDHSLQTVAAIEFLIRENDWEYGSKDMLLTVPWSDAIIQHLSAEVSKGSDHRALLKLGGLFHDIAKPRTKFVDDVGRAHFLGHPKDGAVIVADILSRLRFSNKEINLVDKLVYYHLRPVQMSSGKEFPTQRAIYRYFRDTDGLGIDILFLALADYLATCGPLVKMEEWEEYCQLMNYILAGNERQQTDILPVKLVDGHDLMNIFGLTPGPLLGKFLASVREAQASGELSDKEGALAFVEKKLSKQRCHVGSGN